MVLSVTLTKKLSSLVSCRSGCLRTTWLPGVIISKNLVLGNGSFLFLPWLGGVIPTQISDSKFDTKIVFLNSIDHQGKIWTKAKVDAVCSLFIQYLYEKKRKISAGKSHFCPMQCSAKQLWASEISQREQKVQ
jgi:hypothetical protein